MTSNRSLPLKDTTSRHRRPHQYAAQEHAPTIGFLVRRSVPSTTPWDTFLPVSVRMVLVRVSVVGDMCKQPAPPSWWVTLDSFFATTWAANELVWRVE